MSVAYYITAHGFGHFVRSAAVIKALPAEIPLAVRTDIPRWFLDQELIGREYTLDSGGFDCGTFGPDSTRVDTELTFQRAADVNREAQALLEAEIAFLRSHQIRVVVTDMPSFPLKVAKRAGIPSICITNFTWVEIYETLAERAAADGRTGLAEAGRRLIEQMRFDYAAGDLLLKPGMALEMGACRQQIDVPVIARTGRDKRKELCAKLGLDPAKPLYLLYLGQDGYDGVDWSQLGSFDGAQFFTFKPIPAAEKFVHVIPKGLMEHSDASASADAVIGKLGYSLCAECMATRTPLVFPPRPDFVEAVALSRDMLVCGLGIPVSADDFRSLNWSDALKRVAQTKASSKQVDCSGAQICSEIIALAWREGSLKVLHS